MSEDFSGSGKNSIQQEQQQQQQQQQQQDHLKKQEGQLVTLQHR